MNELWKNVQHKCQDTKFIRHYNLSVFMLSVILELKNEL